MSKRPNQQDPLRHKAEAQIARALTDDEVSRTAKELLHELHVHQIELEMQNEELRCAQISLEESRDRYVDLYEFAPVGYLTLSHGAQIAAINLTGAVLLGEERKKLLQRRFSHLVAPADLGAWQLYFMQAIRHGGQQVCELRLQRSDGTFFDAHLDGLSNMSDPATPALRITLTDISERKRLDRLLQEKNDELELAKLVAEKANRAKSAFLSNMSHELRTPLNAILGFAQLMEASSPPPSDTQRARLGKITESGWYLLKLINEILDLATIESGRLALAREAVPLAEIMCKCSAMIEAQARQRGIQINFLPLDESWFVDADRTRLKQILLNLLSNALKYNREHGTITVACRRSAEHIRISVKDCGAGLTAEKMAQLFQPFNRLGQENCCEEGTGIGLVLAKRLVELMGGAIGVESTVGIGSEFWIELPRGAAPQSATKSAARAEPAPPGIRGETPHTVLCIEDDPVNLMLIEQIVKEVPHLRLLSANAGNPGIALARTHLPDVILMDLNLPDLGGIEALQTLHKDAATAHIPVIALTASATCRDVAKGLDAGFFEYLTKPIKIDELMSTLDDALLFTEMRCANTQATGE